jgi:hypothetical protein
LTVNLSNRMTLSLQSADAAVKAFLPGVRKFLMEQRWFTRSVCHPEPRMYQTVEKPGALFATEFDTLA